MNDAQLAHAALRDNACPGIGSRGPAKAEGHCDNRKPQAAIELLPGAVEEAAAFLADKSESLARLDRVAELIEGFETPYGTELPATVHRAGPRLESLTRLGACGDATLPISRGARLN
jgi:hypothetical protein